MTRHLIARCRRIQTISSTRLKNSSKRNTIRPIWAGQAAKTKVSKSTESPATYSSLREYVPTIGMVQPLDWQGREKLAWLTTPPPSLPSPSIPVEVDPGHVVDIPHLSRTSRVSIKPARRNPLVAQDSRTSGCHSFKRAFLPRRPPLMD
ncbi:PREDICTED: uncharacterized protein LOC105143803 isoform X2 [Acromyrmex echinatior]|uniref:uncharacterized protein LOC105143803 isoform X2 n=1 Tax=Acromyrmex echinatior TaxID=103372 RepID=UPI000580C8DA|nr:PREDICTED: uncharacterized protein LOC105143803 isoform X2 [Acromyrmex echinatior]